MLLLPCREAGCRRPPTKALFCLPLVVVKGTLLPAFGCGLSKGWLLTTSNKPGLCAGSIVESEDVSALHSLSLLCYAPLLLPSSPIRRRESDDVRAFSSLFAALRCCASARHRSLASDVVVSLSSLLVSRLVSLSPAPVFCPSNSSFPATTREHVDPLQLKRPPILRCCSPQGGTFTITHSAEPEGL